MSGCGIGWTWRWRPTLIGALAFALCAVGVNAQTAQPGQRFGFDYLTTDLSTFSVARFEMSVDDGTWVDLGLPSSSVRPETPSGAVTFTVPIPALTPGTHTVSFRACNTACGDGSAAFTFELVAQPPAPGGTRIVGGV